MGRNPNRREFLKSGLVTTAAALTVSSGILDPVLSLADSAPDLVVSYGNDPEAMTRTAIDALGGISRFVKPGNKVLIKPNMSFASGPAAGSNTHPLIVREVAKLCADAGASKISVVDNVLHSAPDCMRLSKIPEICNDLPNTTVNVVKNKRLFREVKVEHGKQLKSMEVLADALDADVLIALPVGKSHSSSGVSLSMKGMMGLVFDRMTFHRHDLHESIVDMVTVLKPHLVVVDGTRILSTGGPGGPGKVIPLNLVIASTDMVAADAQMVALGTWYGKQFEPQQVRHIRSAAERGLGRMDLGKLNIKTIKA